MIRKATLQDAEQIASIYNYYVLNSIATFEEIPVDAYEIEQRMQNLPANYPWIVYEEKGIILGYAYANSWKQRTAYRHSVESTVYLKQGILRKGMGTTLYKELLILLKKLDVHAVIGGISLPNEASIALHEKFGFEKVAHFKEVGYKFNKWIDVGYWEVLLLEN